MAIAAKKKTRGRWE